MSDIHVQSGSNWAEYGRYSQAMGARTLAVGPFANFSNHQILIRIVDSNNNPAIPTSGTFTCATLSLGTDVPIEFSNSLNLIATPPDRQWDPIEDIITDVIITPTGLDAGLYYYATIVHWN